MEQLIKKAAKEISKAKNAVALTGAGISVESGIPPFRGKGGLWEKFDPMEYASIYSFLKDPAKVWKVLLMDMKKIMDTAQPNNAHNGLAKLENLGILKTIITQNVDGLHQVAGNNDVIEFHGSFANLYCMECNKQFKMENIGIDEFPPKCKCKGIIRPDCVFFGEQIPEANLDRSRKVSANCDLMLIIGTSGVVQPAAMMPHIAKDSNAFIIEINADPTPYTNMISDIFLQGRAGEIMKKIINELE